MIRLNDAALCVSCEWISASRTEYCPKCGDKGLLNLANVLDRVDTFSQKELEELFGRV